MSFLEATVPEAIWLFGRGIKVRISDLVKHLPRASADFMKQRGVYLVIGFNRKLNSWAIYVDSSKDLWV